MRRRSFLSALGGFALSAAARADELAALLAQASRPARFAAPDAAELADAQALFADILGTGDAQRIAARANALGMHWARLDAAIEVLAERSGEQRGRGLYAFRRGARAAVVLQMPHAFKDLRTREIGLALFAGGDFEAAAWNTLPRWRQQGGERTSHDLAHLPASWFTAFSRAIAEARTPRRVVQLHGFDAAGRDTPLAAIVSNATHRPEPALRALAGCMERATGRPVAVFPEQTRLLGGTRNAQAAVLLGHQRFIHIEMDRALREALTGDAALLSRFAQCLVETPS